MISEKGLKTLANRSQMSQSHIDGLLKYVNLLFNNHRYDPILEFGVCVGASIANMAKKLNDLQLSNRIIGFDSFKGLPNDEGVKVGWKKGDFAVSLKIVQESLIDWPNIELVEGWYDEVLTEDLKKNLELTSASLIHIDSDLYCSAVSVLKWCHSLLTEGSILVFDEWPVFEKQAWEEFSEKNNIKYRKETDQSLSERQGIITVLGA